jgi:hypothetical protein
MARRQSNESLGPSNNGQPFYLLYKVGDGIFIDSQTGETVAADELGTIQKLEVQVREGEKIVDSWMKAIKNLVPQGTDSYSIRRIPLSDHRYNVTFERRKAG